MFALNNPKLGRVMAISALMICALLVSPRAWSMSIVIDEFEGNSFTVKLSAPGQAPDPPTEQKEPGVLGEYREVYLEQGGVGTTSATVNNGNSSLLSVSTQSLLPNAFNKTSVVWDGSGIGVDALGLNQDLSAYTAFALKFDIVQQATDVKIHVESSGGAMAEYKLELAKGEIGVKEIPFSNFGGFNFSDIKRIRLDVNHDSMTDNLDMDVDFFRATGPVIPEPANSVLAGMGLICLFTVTHRPKRQRS